MGVPSRASVEALRNPLPAFRRVCLRRIDFESARTLSASHSSDGSHSVARFAIAIQREL